MDFLNIKPDSLFLTGPHEFHSIIPDLELIQKQPISYYAILFFLEEGKEVLERILTIPAGYMFVKPWI